MDFNFKFTKSKVEALLPDNNHADEWFELMKDMLPKYKIDTVNRVAGFIAQCSHESRQFTVLEENLNYSANALNLIFPKYFKKIGRDADDYHRDPKAIANVIYANRMGNGNTKSGEGWKFRGRGVIQLTGKNNYKAFAESIDKSLNKTIDYVKSKKGALESACWYWNSRKLNDTADDKDIIRMTKKINGGTIGLEDRKHHWKEALAILSGDKEAKARLKYETVRLGSSGDTVKAVQKELGISADGIFGPGTEMAVKKWQDDNDLVADGIVGPQSLKKMLG
jgi:putative chitinase